MALIFIRMLLYFFSGLCTKQQEKKCLTKTVSIFFATEVIFNQDGPVCCHNITAGEVFVMKAGEFSILLSAGDIEML